MSKMVFGIISCILMSCSDLFKSQRDLLWYKIPLSSRQHSWRNFHVEKTPPEIATLFKLEDKWTAKFPTCWIFILLLFIQAWLLAMDWWLWWMMNIDYHSIHFNQFYFAGENFLCIYIDGNNWSAFHLSSWYCQHEEEFNLKILETKWTTLSPQKEMLFWTQAGSI